MELSLGFAAVALKLQEASLGMAHSEVRDRLSNALREHGKTAHDFGYTHYVDHTGDGNTGDCVYNCDDCGGMMSAPYTTESVNGKVNTHIDHEKAKPVHPRVSYEPLADDADHYAAMESQKLYKDLSTLGLPLFERFISKTERAAMDKADFAGKGTSYPIKNQTDVEAAMHAIGRAGDGNYSGATIKSNIKKIAARKGLKVPGDGEETRESDRRSTSDLRLVESAATMEPIVLREARSDYEIKLIAPGKGSSAFYPAEVLKRDGPNVFTEGTHVYLNHATAAEEAQRPEGDVRNLAGVLTRPAYWSESHRNGPGLYSRMKVFADHAQTVEEKAPHVGMSIRACGVREAGKTQDGLPILKELTAAESVDVVTRPGAGGMILTEAARSAKTSEQEVDVDNAAIQKLQESNRKMAQRLARQEAREAGILQLAAIRLPDEQKEKILARCVESAPITVDGDFDGAGFKSLVEREIKYAGELLGGGQIVTDMGTGAPATLTEAQRAETAKSEKRRVKESARLMGIEGKAGRRIYAEGRAAFDYNYNAADPKSAADEAVA